MRVRTFFMSARHSAVTGFVLACACALSVLPAPGAKHSWKRRATQDASVQYVLPGVLVKITAARIAADGTISVDYQVTDPTGVPLDQNGVLTPGAVNGSLTAAVLPHGQSQYVNYLANPSMNATTGVSFLNGSDEDIAANQVTSTATGQYTFTFMGKAPSGFDVTATHTVGIYVSRDLTAYGLKTYSADDVFSFVPNGSPVVEYKDVIRTQTCNKCHAPLAAHELRHTIALCELCHVSGAGDSSTGTTVDIKVFFHKIHMGSSLPSVIAGTPFQINGHGGLTDYSGVVFPADTRNCAVCHEGGSVPAPVSSQPGQGGLGAPANSTITQTGAPAPEIAGATTGTGTALINPTGAACGSANNPGCNPELLPWPPAQADNWINNPNRAACGSCHDNVNFASGLNHVNLPQPDDAQCHICHTVKGELPFDASIVGAHTIPQFAPGLPGVVFKLLSVTGGTAGTAPTVSYSIADKSGNPVAPSQMDFLNLVMSGPTGDYQNIVSEDARMGSAAAGGAYSYTLTATVPAGATGSYSIGIEGFRNVTLLPGTVISRVARDVGFNQVMDFSVDGSAVAPHPVEATQAQCNSCHFALSLHGTIRQNVQYCLLCHNPGATDVSQRPATAGSSMTIDFPVLIHRLHLGDESQNVAPNNTGQLSPFTIYGFGGNPANFDSLQYPGALTQCNKCHSNGSQELPLLASRVAVNSPYAFINPTPPTTAACTACHIAKDSSSHALANVTSLGESCDVCHGPTAQFSVDSVHAQ